MARGNQQWQNLISGNIGLLLLFFIQFVFCFFSDEFSLQNAQSSIYLILKAEPLLLNQAPCVVWHFINDQSFWAWGPISKYSFVIFAIWLQMTLFFLFLSSFHVFISWKNVKLWPLCIIYSQYHWHRFHLHFIVITIPINHSKTSANYMATFPLDYCDFFPGGKLMECPLVILIVQISLQSGP